MTNIARMALGFAIREMDAGHGEVGENNSGPHVEKYLHGFGEAPANWCAAFVSWCYHEAWLSCESSMPFQYTLSAKNMMNQFKQWHIFTDKPERGDVVFFWRESPTSWMGHVGFVEEVGHEFIYTIEGNKGVFPSKVDRYKYFFPAPQLLGYGRIK